MSMATRTLRGALAGAAAAAVWAAQQPLDRRVFGVPYDDTELLGRWVVPVRRRAGSRPASRSTSPTARCSAPPTRTSRRRCRSPPALRGPLAGLAEHLATWPGTAVLDRVHPARSDLPQLWGSGRAFAQATWRHLLFGFVLGELERRLNPPEELVAPVDDDGRRHERPRLRRAPVARPPL